VVSKSGVGHNIIYIAKIFQPHPNPLLTEGAYKDLHSEGVRIEKKIKNNINYHTFTILLSSLWIE